MTHVEQKTVKRSRADLAPARLHSQQIAAPRLQQPEAVVSWLGAVQAQDYAAAKWALGLRLPGITDAAIERAFAAGTILRTHVLRPTWHFVTPADIRWMLTLTAPRIHALSAYLYRKLELDTPTFIAGEAALARALQGGKQLTRPELAAVLEQAGISGMQGLRFLYLLGHAELEGLVCSGGRRGNEFTYCLLDERVPAVAPLTRDVALAKLAQRYFTSHGPATLADFVWWSGLTVADARAGLAQVSTQLQQEVIDGQTYWMAPQTLYVPDQVCRLYLLPNYDEYVVGYTDRSALFDSVQVHKLDPRGNILFSHTVVLDGQIAGTWKRTLKKREVILEATLLAAPTPVQTAALAEAAARYGAFVDRPVVLQTGLAAANRAAK